MSNNSLKMVALNIIAAAIGALRPPEHEINEEVMQRGLYIDTYAPKVYADRYGDRSKYNPRECDRRRREKAALSENK